MMVKLIVVVFCNIVDHCLFNRRVQHRHTRIQIYSDYDGFLTRKNDFRT
jgi:hypothetical protein